MEYWTETDADYIIHLYTCGSAHRTAERIATDMHKSYTHVRTRLNRLVNFGIVSKAKRIRTVFYSKPSENAVIKAIMIRDKSDPNAARKLFNEATTRVEKDKEAATAKVEKAKEAAKKEAAAMFE